MGKQIVCDRCGAEIKKQPNIELPIVVVVKADVKETLLGDFYEFYLCDKCNEDLVEWIRKGKEQDK